MAKSKADLIKKGKELGLNLTNKMSVYELEHRIADREKEIEENKEPEKKSKTPAKRGEY